MQPAPFASAGVLLRCTGLAKRFGAVQALRGVDFSIAAGRVRGLVGENGAGKSTLAKIIAGVNAPDAGSMEFEGRPIRSASADEALAQRIVTVHQDINLIPSMTVIENLLLNNEPASRLGIIRRRDARETAKALLDRYEIAADPEAPVEELSNDLRKMIQIVKAIHRDPKVLILDEPTSSLTSAAGQRRPAPHPAAGVAGRRPRPDLALSRTKFSRSATISPSCATARSWSIGWSAT